MTTWVATGRTARPLGWIQGARPLLLSAQSRPKPSDPIKEACGGQLRPYQDGHFDRAAPREVGETRRREDEDVALLARVRVEERRDLARQVVRCAGHLVLLVELLEACAHVVDEVALQPVPAWLGQASGEMGGVGAA